MTQPTIMLIVAFVALVLLAVGWFYFFGGFGGNHTLKEGYIEINEEVFKVDVADTLASRTQGLSGREKLEEREGMLFLFGSAGTHSFWMKDMKFPIDIVWIKGNTVVGVSENALPEPGTSLFLLKRYAPPEPVDKVLEVNAGIAEQYGIISGTEIDFADIPQSPI